jgi:hypothetical protein
MTEHIDPILDVHAFISVKVMSNGGVQISGNIADKSFALRLLDHAKDAIKSQRTGGPQLLAADGSPVVVPARDVDVPFRPEYQTSRTLGDMAPEDRGDLPP